MAMEMWGQVVSAIDDMVHRIQDLEDFDVEPGSQLAADDASSHPYEVSHCVQNCLNAGVDHLHAAKALMFDVPILHANAEYSLFRGALENFGAAFWVLHPAQRSKRVEHALRWMVKNLKDHDNATAKLSLPGYTPARPNP
jgi:hypothetical protein